MGLLARLECRLSAKWTRKERTLNKLRSLPESERCFWDIVCLLQRRGLLPTKSPEAIEIGRVREYEGNERSDVLWPPPSSWCDHVDSKIEATVTMTASWERHGVVVELWHVQQDIGKGPYWKWCAGSISLHFDYELGGKVIVGIGGDKEQNPWIAEAFLFTLTDDPNCRERPDREWRDSI